MHRDPPHHRAAGPCRGGDRRDLGARLAADGDRRSARREHPDGRAGLDRAEARRAREGRDPGSTRPSASLAIRRPSRSTGADAATGAFLPPMLFHCADPDAAITRSRHRGLRAGLDGDGLSRSRSRHRAGQSRPGQPGGLADHPRRRRGARRWCWAPGAYHGRIYVNNRDSDGRVHRPRLAAAAHGPWRAGARRRRRGTGRHARRDALHAAHRRAGQPRHPDRDRRRVGAGRDRDRGAGASLHPAASTSWPSARRSTPARAP